MSKKARGYCFTINNYTVDDTECVNKLSKDCRYIIVGREVGENGTPHYQGYVFFENPRSFSGVKKLIPRAHIEVAKATPKQNSDYCRKQNDILIEEGDVPVCGKRTDLDDIRDVVRENPRMSNIVDVAKSYQAIKVAEIYLKYHEEPRTWKPEVRWYHGSTGSGKTKLAREWLGDDVYTSLDSIKWWEGYDGHENVLIDDFRKDFCKFHQLLKLLDRYEYKVEVKGGSRQFRAKKIAITSPYPPDKMYKTREDVNQLLRRIDDVILVGDIVEDPDILRVPIIYEDDL